MSNHATQKPSRLHANPSYQSINGSEAICTRKFLNSSSLLGTLFFIPQNAQRSFKIIRYIRSDSFAVPGYLQKRFAISEISTCPISDVPGACSCRLRRLRSVQRACPCSIPTTPLRVVAAAAVQKP